MMMPAHRPYLFLLVGLMLIAQVHTQVSDSLKKRLDFLSVLKGVYDDTTQVKEDSTNRDVVQVRIIPVRAPAIQPDSLYYYFEESLNDNVYRMWVCTITEGSNGAIIVTPYNFTDTSKYKPGQFDPKEISNLNPEDFHSYKDCSAAFIQIAPAVYNGNWPDCRHNVDGRNPAYVMTITCNSINFTPSLASTETTLLVPYQLKDTGVSVPMADVPEGYVGLCD